MNLITTFKHIAKKIIDRRPIINTQVNVNLTSENCVLKNRCALITGGTSGIGYSIAEGFLRAGSNVIITGRNDEKIQKSVSLLKSKFKNSVIIGFRLDNSDVSSFNSFFANMQSICKKNNIGVIDILVNNAGVNGGILPNITEREYDQIMHINLKGTFFLSQIVGKYFVKNQIKGNILNISSASSLRPGNSPYILSKWGIRSLTLGLAKSLGPYGITVNSIAPGPTATPMMMNSQDSNMTLNRIPLGRYIMPEEIASVAVMLVSDVGRSIMGDTIYMCGGAGLLTYDDIPYNF